MSNSRHFDHFRYQRRHHHAPTKGYPVTSPTGRPLRPVASRVRRWFGGLTTTVTATTAGGVLLLGAPASLQTAAGPGDPPGASEPALALVSADRQRWPGHPGRTLVRYRVRHGDTATGLAVRFHAWTDELRSLNRLGRSGTLYVGERIRIPVVTAAASRNRTHRTHRTHRASGRPTLFDAKARRRRREIQLAV